MTILVMLCLLSVGLPALWIWWVNRKVRRDYRGRWDKLNSKVGGVLPSYDEVRKKGDKR